MGVDEDGAGMLAEDVVLLGHQLLPGGIGGGIAVALGFLLQFQPAFVVGVLRLPERGRFAGMDQHRDAQLAAFGPDGIEAGIVDRHPRAVLIRHVETQVLVDLQPAGAVLHVGAELAQGLFLPAWFPHAAEIDIGEEDEAARRICLDVGDRLLQKRTLIQPEAQLAVRPLDAPESPPAQVDHHRHVQFIHFRSQFAEILSGHRPLVIVHVDERILGAGDGMFRHHQGGGGIVFLEREGLGEKGRCAETEQQDGGEQLHEVFLSFRFMVDIFCFTINNIYKYEF